MPKAGKSLIITTLVLSLVSTVFSQEKLTLTLEECIQLALAQNPSHLAAVERVEGAKSKMKEALAGFFPSLSASGLRTLKEKIMILEFPSFIPGQPPQRMELDFTRDYQATFSLSVPLYVGGQLKSGFNQAKYNRLSSEESLRQSAQSTVFNTKIAFYGYLLAREFVAVAAEAVTVAEKHLKNVQTMYDVGMSSKFDLLRSEVQMANLKPQLIKAENNLKVAELGLKTFLGVDLDRPIEVEGELDFTPIEPDVEEAMIQAVQNRPEIQQLDYQKLMAGELLKMSRGSRYPTIAISGAFNFWADKFNFNQDTWQSYYAVNLAVSVPIFRGFVSGARIAQSKSMIREIELGMQGLEDMIVFEVRQALLKLEEAKESLFSQEKNVEQATESLRIAELNFAEGLATTLDVSSTQAALSQAKTNYSQALFDYVVSLAELEKAMGVGPTG